MTRTTDLTWDQVAQRLQAFQDHLEETEHMEPPDWEPSAELIEAHEKRAARDLQRATTVPKPLKRAGTV